MYADYNTAVSVRGTAEELAAIAEVLWEYKTKAVNISLSSIKTIEGEIDLFLASKEQFLSIVSSARDGFDVEASGPYGQYSDLGDVDLFKDMADVAPDSYFHGEIHGMSDGSGCYEDAYATLEDGKLSLRYTSEPIGDAGEEDASDYTFCISGSLKYFENRDALADELEAYGAEIAGSVTDETDYLICNDSEKNSAKVNKAKELDVEIISELEFIWRFGIYPDMFDESDLDEYREEAKEETSCVYDPKAKEYIG